MKDILAQVLSNERVSSTYYVLTLQAPSLEKVSPGQFLQVLCRKPGAADPFLRRPFSVMDRRGDTIELVYKVIGPGTTFMSELKPGAETSILGPLGKGFNLERTEQQKTLVIAGGTGLGGIYYLCRTLRDRKRQLFLLYGVRTRDEIATSVLHRLDIPYQVAVEDEDGYVTGQALQQLDLSEFSHAAICGPTPMMKAAVNALDRKIPSIEVSLEEMMGCGFGICYTCPVQRSDKKGYYNTCEQGPVFQHDLITLT